ncbi:MAG: MFS transporter [Chloroflexota bacterium]|nr:MFS transporter [Chloroflexota bacterium]
MKTRSLHLSLKARQTIGYFAALTAIGFYIASLGPTLPDLASHTSSALAEISVLFSARSFGYLVGSMGGGKLYDKLPGHRLLALLMLMTGAMMALAPVISLLWLLAIVLFILGIGEGGIDVGSNILLIWVHGRNVSPYMNGLHFFFGLGAFLSPIIIAQTVLFSGDIKIGYWLLALYALPVAMWFLRTPAPVPPDQTKDKNIQDINVFLVAMISLFFFLYVGAEASFGGWIFTYTIEMDIIAKAGAAYLIAAFWGALTLGRLIGIPIASRFRPRTIILSDLIGCLVSVTILILWPESMVLVWIGTIGMGLFLASLFPTMLVLAERRMRLTGGITRWFFVGTGLGGMFLPWLIGQLFVPVGPQVMLWLILIDLLFVLVIAIGIVHQPRRDRITNQN